MTWEVYGAPYYNDSDLTDKTIFQSVKFARSSVLRACRVWVIVHGDPTFTALSMRVYANDENAASRKPSSLLHVSENTWAKADLHSQAYAVKEIHFEFDFPTLRGGTWYHFVLSASGYSGASESSHIAWRYAYPDPIYKTNVTLEKQKLSQYPLTFYPIFAEFNAQ